MSNFLYDKSKQKVPVKLWTPIEGVEVAALQQLQNTSQMPFVFKHVAAMPDVHLGIGATVGSVIATKGAVMPAAVGVDIGCGMMAMKLHINADQAQEKAAAIRSAIEAVVPVGFKDNGPLVTAGVGLWEGWYGQFGWQAVKAGKEHASRAQKEMQDKALAQMGTLGGGNHFIELCLDTEGQVWLMLHSGSRGIGNMIAKIYMDRAKVEMKRMFIQLPDPDLAYFVEGTKDYRNYMNDLNWAQLYAAENREEMARRILQAISEVLGAEYIQTSNIVNCHHNYASMENHYGENVLVTRKGAVRAREGDLGIIPGSMGTKSYIVQGLGNKESFNSCSHGAGRRMSRTAAKKLFTVDDLALQTAGVECRKDADVVDEIPGAYKDIDIVMENQKDLVKVVAQLKQFLCIKG